MSIEWYEIFQLATENEIEAIKYGLVNVRQFQVYVDALKQELKNVMNRLSNLDQELLQRITDIQRKSPNYFGTSFRNPILH